MLNAHADMSSEQGQKVSLVLVVKEKTELKLNLLIKNAVESCCLINISHVPGKDSYRQSSICLTTGHLLIILCVS